MRRLALPFAFGLAIAWSGPALAGENLAGNCPPQPCPSYPVPGPTPYRAPDQTGAPGANAAQPPATDAFAQAPPTGGEAAQTGLPNMIGDLGFYGVTSSGGSSAGLTAS